MILQAPGPGVPRPAKSIEQVSGDLLRGLRGPAFVVTEGLADWGPSKNTPRHEAERMSQVGLGAVVGGIELTVEG